MKAHILYSLLAVVLFSGTVRAQLSPGDLSNAHKDLEGISNCTKCHDLGNKVSNTKCLDCHKEIKSRVDRNEGYHASWEVKGKDCAKCHSDHHGRKFDMVRFDESKFDHQLTGYELTGRHKSGWSSKGQKIDCRSCHKPDLIVEPELKSHKETFLGLSQACADCHKDVHQKTLGRDCAKCHNTEEFNPAKKFNHDKSDFPLTGRHKEVACIECHKKELRNGAEFQKFDGIPFKSCADCHQDPHQSKLGVNCKECHSTVDFDDPGGFKKFDHSKTHFPLKGRHQKVDCRECHNMSNTTPLNVFQDRLGIPTQDCKICHKDPHEDRFGNNCSECHNESGWRKTGDLDKFNHDRTDFALTGRHIAVDCRKCHISEKMTDPLPFKNCADCHKDYHDQQFAEYTISPDCAKCHTTDGFLGSTFTIEDHAKTKYKLDGAHLATPCFACHLKEGDISNYPPPKGKWKFRQIGERCVDCHKDPHEGQIAEKWYPNKSCEQCHLTASFQESRFDHSKTEFALTGVHQKIACSDCHKPQPGYKYGQFDGLSSQCAQCHEEVHNRQFEKSGVTDCAACHNSDGWTILKFNHDKTRFKLEGKHLNVSCDKCHKEVTTDGLTYVQYKFDNFECVVCHN